MMAEAEGSPEEYPPRSICGNPLWALTELVNAIEDLAGKHNCPLDEAAYNALRTLDHVQHTIGWFAGHRCGRCGEPGAASDAAPAPVNQPPTSEEGRQSTSRR